LISELPRRVLLGNPYSYTLIGIRYRGVGILAPAVLDLALGLVAGLLDSAYYAYLQAWQVWLYPYGHPVHRPEHIGRYCFWIFRSKAGRGLPSSKASFKNLPRAASLRKDTKDIIFCHIRLR